MMHPNGQEKRGSYIAGGRREREREAVDIHSWGTAQDYQATEPAAEREAVTSPPREAPLQEGAGAKQRGKLSIHEKSMRDNQRKGSCRRHQRGCR